MCKPLVHWAVLKYTESNPFCSNPTIFAHRILKPRQRRQNGLRKYLSMRVVITKEREKKGKRRRRRKDGRKREEKQPHIQMSNVITPRLRHIRHKSRRNHLPVPTHLMFPVTQSELARQLRWLMNSQIALQSISNHRVL